MSTPLEEARDYKKLNVSAERIARVYAESLYKAAPAGQDEELGAELLELVGVLFPKVANLENFFSSGIITKSQKAEFIDKQFAGKASETFVNFLHILNNHGRLDLLHAIALSYQELVDEKHRRVNVVVKSAVALDDTQRDSLKKQLNEMFNFEPKLEEQIDPELLGGLIVRVGDWQFDGTVKARLNQLKNQLLERSSHEIQGRRDRFCTV
jgi:F-type H+-transporting ATPase subunit delta